MSYYRIYREISGEQKLMETVYAESQDEAERVGRRKYHGEIEVERI